MHLFIALKHERPRTQLLSFCHEVYTTFVFVNINYKFYFTKALYHKKVSLSICKLYFKRDKSKKYLLSLEKHLR